MALNLNEIKVTESTQVLVDKLNENFQLIANSNGGPEGKSGNPGGAGLPGPRGPVGLKGDTGQRGSKWWNIANTALLPNAAIVGDYAVISTNGDFYELKNDGWIKQGTFNFSQGLTFDLEDISYTSVDGEAETSLKTLINAKTNNTLLLTNIDKPDPSLGLQIPTHDSPGDSYPFIQGSDSLYKDLYDYKLKIYNSGNSEDDTTQMYGRHIHLGNSFAMTQKSGWLTNSGFTIGVDLHIDDINDTGEGREILSIEGRTSGNPEHLHRLQIENADLWVNTFRIGKNGTTSVGFADDYTPTQKLEINGGIRIGDTSIETDGSIRFKDGEFQGFDGTEWVDLSITAQEVVDLIKTNQASFNDKVIDTSGDGGVIFGDMSSVGTLKAGAVRYNSGTGDFEGYNGTSWVVLNNKVSLGSTGGPGEPGGPGGTGNFVDENGDPINSKIAVNTNDPLNAGNPIYEGLVLTSEDGSVTLNQSVLESKYSVVDLSSNGIFGAVDSEGNPISVKGFDINSDDIQVDKNISDGKINYQLKLSDSSKFKDAVNDAFDLRSSDGTVIANPPSDDRTYWDLKVSPGAGLQETQPATARYTGNTATPDLEYSVAYGGHYSYLSFETKDFDANCNITSKDPLTIEVAKGQNGYYNVSARVRFTIDTYPGGTLASVKLCVFKDNTVVSVLNSVTTGDSYDITHNNSKEYELQGTDLVDFACTTEDCSNEFKVGIVVDFGTSSGTGSLSMGDSSIAIHRITTVTQDSVDAYLLASNVAFTEVTLYNDANVETANLLSLVNDGHLKLAAPDYITYEILDDTYLKIDANIAALQAALDPNSTILKNSLANIKVDTSFTHNADDDDELEFISGTNISLNLTGNKLTINSTAPKPTVQSDGANVASTYDNIDFSSEFSVTEAGGKVSVSMNKDNSGGKHNVIHLSTNYYGYLSTIQSGTNEDIQAGILNYNTFSNAAAAGIRYRSVGEEILDSDLGAISHGDLTGGIVLVPEETAKYSISTNVGIDFVMFNEAFSPVVNYTTNDLGHAGIGLFKLSGGGSYTIKTGLGTASASLVKMLGSASTPIDIMRTWNKNSSPDRVSLATCTRIGGTTILELTEDEKYVFGVVTGPARAYIDVYRRKSNELTVQALGQMDDFKALLYDADISVEKIL